MAWLILIVSGGLEAVWATALSKSDGFSRWLPSTIFAVAVVGSMVGLGYALRTLPVGTAYAVWTAIGAAGTVIYAMLTGAESVSVLKLVCLVGIVACVIGLKLAH